MNEIIISKDAQGNDIRCIIGSVAHDFDRFLKGENPKVFKLTAEEKYFVFEKMGVYHYVHRASLSTKETAMNYMGNNRILVYRNEEGK